MPGGSRISPGARRQTACLSLLWLNQAARQSGQLKALAITSQSRAKDLPDTPTMKEAGVDLDVSLWTGLFVPRGTPEAIQTRLREAANQSISNDLPIIVW